jgi:hypothetical protein
MDGVNSPSTLPDAQGWEMQVLQPSSQYEVAAHREPKDSMLSKYGAGAACS